MKWNSHLIHLPQTHNPLGKFLPGLLSPYFNSWYVGLDILLLLQVTCHAVRNSVHLRHAQPQTVSFTTWTAHTTGARRARERGRLRFSTKRSAKQRKPNLPPVKVPPCSSSQMWAEMVFCIYLDVYK